MKLTKSNWFWLLLLIMVAFFTLVAATGYLGKAVRLANRTVFDVAKSANSTVFDVAKIVVQPYRRINAPEAIRDYLKSHPVGKLQLGAGGNNPVGWLNTDIAPTFTEVYLDATDRYPVPDGSFQYVFSEHMIEHVPWEAGFAMLKECYRVLAPGGKLRIVTPNLSKFVRLLDDGTDPEAQRFIDAKLRLHGWPITPVPGAYILNRQVREWGHQFLYDPSTLRRTLELAGFKQITEHPVEEKTDPVFQEVEIRTRLNPGSKSWMVNKWEAMAFEAVR
jgi:predicted SAM-dependent methyltransferase